MSRIDRTLIIFKDPLDRILSGRKIWEMRSRATRIRGRIGLSEKGLNAIRGSAEIVDCIGPLTFAQLVRNYRKLGLSPREFRDQAPDWRQAVRQGRYAWRLARVRRYRKPIRFRNPSGAVIFARLPSRIRARLR